MCEREYVACGQCSTPADELTYSERIVNAETCTYSVDDDGEVRHDTADYPGDMETISTEDGHFECPNCGWCGTDLDYSCVSDDCECDECMPPEPDDEGDDPDEIVWLVRTNDSRRFDLHDTSPPELRRLLRDDRTIDRLPMPRWRAVELWTQHIEPVGAWPLEVDFTTPVTESLIEELMIPCERTDDPQLQLETEATVGAQ